MIVDSPTPPPEPKVRSRRAILDLLKTEGGLESRVLAERLGLTTMGVRQHLYELERQGLVSHKEEARALGRPAKIWSLATKANEEFPDAHAELTVSLLGAMEQAFGPDGLEQLLQVRRAQVLTGYREKLAGIEELPRRVAALAEVRSAEGYMAQVQTAADGTLLLVENHCPICAAAAICQGLCAIELEVFQQLLGPAVAVTRTDHIQQGARRCAYRIEVLPPIAQA